MAEDAENPPTPAPPPAPPPAPLPEPPPATARKPVAKVRGSVSLVLLAGLLVYGAVAGTSWWRERRRARDELHASRLRSSQQAERELPATRFLEGHREGVQAVAFSPDGATLVSGGTDKVAIVWDFAPGKARLVLDGHDAVVWGVAVSPDNARVATAGADGTVMVWDARGGDLLALLEGHSRWALCVRFLPDGTLLSGGVEGTLRRWDVVEEKELAVFEGHRGPVYSVAVSPDGRRAASGSFDGTVIVWDVAAARPAWRVAPPAAGGPQRNAAINWVAYSPDGTRLYTVQNFGFVHEYDAQTGEHLRQLEDFTHGLTLDVSPDGKLAAVGLGGGAGLCRLESQQFVRDLSPATMTHAIAFSPDGRHVVAGHGAAPERGYDYTPDARVSVWDVSGLQPPTPTPAAPAPR